ncbi:MAG: glucan biosynthesis protein [Pseudomonadota bacterium]
MEMKDEGAPESARGITRRQLALGAGVLGVLAGIGLPVAITVGRAGGVDLGAPFAFNFEWLRGTAKRPAQDPFVEPQPRYAEALEQIDYDAYQQIRPKPERSLWQDGGAAFPAQLFHLGRYFKLPVAMHVVVDGKAREVLYSPEYFDFGETGLDEELPNDLGFAGFRIMDGGGEPTDWLAFLGAAYFRSSGELNQYGLSARAVAIDTAQPWPEEFPRFTQFWLEPHGEGSGRVTIYALMDGPSLTGAYRMDCSKDGAVIMDVHAELFARKEIARMGIAPMTSMYWFGENDRRSANDWRPEIHDSDGLSIWNGAGERLWRPLINPAVVRTNSFVDDNPKGFGLLQRDRAFHNYEDDGVFYDRRPSLWVEPLGEWGPGVVQLVEIPTDDEIHDNIVAYWVPDAPVTAGSEWSFSYRLYWIDKEPFPPEDAARVIHTRLGNGGVPGQPRPANTRKFVIDFEGGPLEKLEKLDEVMPIVTTTRGTIDNVYALQIVGTSRWRAFFDLRADGSEPINLRCYLRLDDFPLSETWIYEYVPSVQS